MKLAQPLLGFLLSLTVLAGPVRAEFAGPIIDAHSEFGYEISAAKVRLAIDYEWRRTYALSARGGGEESALESHRRVLNLVRSLERKASFLISAKLGGMSLSGTTERRAGLIELNRAANQYSQEAVGFAEILVQHAPHETRWL